jgi:trans-2-enoyl-CoA reductase
MNTTQTMSIEQAVAISDTTDQHSPETLEAALTVLGAEQWNRTSEAWLDQAVENLMFATGRI